MSSAKRIEDVDHKKLDWLLVEDEAGKKYRYERVGPLDVAETAQVEGHYSHGHAFRAALIRDVNGHAMLYQAGFGLPRNIVVEHIEDPTNPWMAVLGMATKEQYKLVG